MVPLCVIKRKITRYGIELEINNTNTNNNNNNKRLDMRSSRILKEQDSMDQFVVILRNKCPMSRRPYQAVQKICK